MISNIIGGLVAGYAALQMTKLIIEKNIKWNLNNILVIIIYAIIIALNYEIIDNFFKVVIIFISNLLLNKQIYKENIENSVIITFLEYIVVLISECIVGLVLSVGLNIISEIITFDIPILKNTIILNVIIMGFAYFMMKKSIKKYKKVVKKVTIYNNLILGIFSLIILICMAALFYKIEITNWKLNNIFLINTAIIITMNIICLLAIIQRLEADKKEKEYRDLAKYSEINASLLEDYSMLNHEHKNQLIIIQGMIENNDKELLEYVNGLIKKKDKIKFKWIRDLNNISFQGLKSFINYKIMEMQAENIKVSVTISKECKKYELENMSTLNKDKIYSIMGVYLDNAKEASRESEEKEVIISGYEENGKMHIEVSNTYAGKVEIEKINNYGYTSKGNGHGTGLYIIEQIIKNSSKFQTVTTLKDIYFSQTLIINTIE